LAQVSSSPAGMDFTVLASPAAVEKELS